MLKSDQSVRIEIGIIVICKKTIALWAILFSVCLQACAYHLPQGDDRTGRLPSDPEVVSRTDEYLSTLVKMNQFSGCALIARNGKVIFKKGYGWANLDWDIANMPQTIFRIGSVSKPFTAAAILMLQERGMLRVEDTLDTYLPEHPQARKISIHHLLSHTSGLPREIGSSEPRRITSIDDMVKRALDKLLEFEPGKGYHYSNIGYLFLASIIEKVSGKSYIDFMTENLFKPTGMKNSGQYDYRAVLKHLATGYALNEEKKIVKARIGSINSYGSGSLYSTVEDLYLWQEALYGERLLNKDSLAMMATPRSKGGYGYGIARTERFRHTVLQHTGEVSGYNAYVARYPDDEVSIVYLSNFDSIPIVRISRDLAAIVFGETYAIPKPLDRKAIRTHPAIYDAYVGEYQLELDKNQVFRVRKENGRLVFISSDGGRKELFPETETRFFFSKDSGDSVTFARDEKNRVTHLTLTVLGGAELVAKKIKS